MNARHYPNQDFDRQNVCEALAALRWAIASEGMSPAAARRGLEEIDTLLRGPTPALSSLIEAYRIRKSQTKMEFPHD